MINEMPDLTCLMHLDVTTSVCLGRTPSKVTFESPARDMALH